MSSLAARVTVVTALALAVGSQTPLTAQSDTTPPTVSITSPAQGERVGRNVNITATASDAVGVKSVTFMVDGTVIAIDTNPPYSVHWTSKGRFDGARTLRAEARDVAGNVGTSAVSVIVGPNNAPATDTTAPTVSITAPAGGTQVTGTVAVTASASDAVGVTSVTIRVDGAAIATLTSSPYTVNWNTGTVAAGSHTLRAEARDAAGNVGLSAGVTVTVAAAANRPPSVTMTAPANGGSYAAPATITLTATASDPDGSVAQVDFYEGTTRIGSDTASPFTMTWTVSTARTYTLSATATDNQGAATTSSTVSVTVTSPSPSRPTTATFVPSADNSSVTQYVLDVFRDGSNPATSTPVATQDLGKPAIVNGEMTADIRQTTASLAPATYIATVSAVTATGRARSAASPPFVIASSATLLSTNGAGRALDARVVPESHGVLWAADSSTGLVTAFDATAGDVLATIPVGLAPAGIAVPQGSGKVYVADEGSDTVSVISKATMTVARTIPLPPPSGRLPHHISASADGRFVYVGERGANVVDVIDTTTDQISARFSTGWPGSKTRVVIPDPTGLILYAINDGAAPSPDTLVALDASTGHRLWQLPLAGGPGDLLIAGDGRTAIVTRESDSRIDVIDLATHTVIKAIDLGGGNDGGALHFALDGRLALVMTGAMRAGARIVDVVTMTVLTSVSLTGPAKATALTARQLSYVIVPGNNEVPAGVIAIDAESRAVVRRFRIPGGGSPRHAVFDPD
jgi:YVTN family beta-propeller protein